MSLPTCTTIIINLIMCLTHVDVWVSMGKPCSCTQFIKAVFLHKSPENPYQYYKSCKNPYQVLQVTCPVSERTLKPKVHMIKSLAITIVQSCTRKTITHLLPLALLLCTCKNTDGNNSGRLRRPQMYYTWHRSMWKYCNNLQAYCHSSWRLNGCHIILNSPWTQD